MPVRLDELGGLCGCGLLLQAVQSKELEAPEPKPDVPEEKIASSAEFVGEF